MNAQPNQEKSPKLFNSLEPQKGSTLWAIGTGSFAGGVIGTVVADEILRGRLDSAILLVIAIFLLSGYKGRTRVIRLSVAGIAAGFFVLAILFLQPQSPAR